MERTLRPEVLRILDLAEVLGRQVAIAIVDDGSHDGTYEAACELAREFPQIVILRQPYQRGLGGALAQVRLRLRVDQVVAHDGVTAIDVEELAEALNASPTTTTPATRVTASDAWGSRRIGPGISPPKPASPPRALRSFRWLRLDEPLIPRRSRTISHQIGASAGRAVPALATSATTFTNPASLAN
jgi:hypothetical protein